LPRAATALRPSWYAAVSARGRYDCKPHKALEVGLQLSRKFHYFGIKIIGF